MSGGDDTAAREAEFNAQPSVDPPDGYVPPEPEHVSIQAVLDEEQLQRLREPLARERVKSRQGRGRNRFEYVEGHDNIRHANAIFGFGNWGTEIVAQEEIGAVEVIRKNDKGEVTGKGWHVAWRAVVRFTVRGCIPVEGTGYGDAAEYGPAARLTACELAIKESETDAMKRAMIKWGDQFGLILYVKQESVRRAIETEDVQEVTRRQEQAGGDIPLPRSWAEIKTRLEGMAPDAGWEHWLDQATGLKHSVPSIQDLPPDVKKFTAFQDCQRLVITLDELWVGPFPPPDRALIQEAFKRSWGVEPPGPPWRLSPTDSDDLPSLEDYVSAQEAARAGADAQEATS